MRILGIDPGGAQVGIAVRDVPGKSCVAHQLVERDRRPIGAFIRATVVAVTQLHAETEPAVIAVEDLVDPTPQMRQQPISVRGLLDTAQVLGALRHAFPSVVVVRPGKHGSIDGLADMPARVARQVLEQTYPPELLGDREQRGAGQLRHCRSAWDVAGAALRQITSNRSTA